MNRPLRTQWVTVAALAALAGCGPSKNVEFAALLPLTGEAAVYGKSIQRGIEVGMEQLAAGAPGGYQMSLRVDDTASDPAKAAELLRAAYATSIAAIGGVTSDEALAMIPVVNDFERVLLSPTASSPELSGSSRWFFRIFPSSEAESAPLASFVSDRLLAKQVVIVATSDAFGRGATKAFSAAFSGEVLGTVSFDTSDFDFGKTVADTMRLLPKAASDDDVRAVYVAASGDALANALTALRGGGFDRGKDYLITSSALASPEILAKACGAAERSYFAQTIFNPASEEEVVKSFVAAYRTKFGGEPDIYAAHGYDAVAVLVKALQEAGSALPSDFVKGMRAVQDFPGVTGTIQFRETGDVQKFMRVYFVSECKAHDFDEFLKEWQDRMRDEMERLKREKERLMRNSPG